jgi:hypothetical protein
MPPCPEELALAACLVLGREGAHDAVQEAARPGGLEEILGPRVVRGLDGVALLAALELERQERPPAAALQGARGLRALGEEVLEGRQQERAEAPAPGVEAPDIAALEQVGEEALGRVARVLRAEAAPARVGVERVPRGRAQLLEREARRRRIVAGEARDAAPARRGEAARRDREGHARSRDLGRGDGQRKLARPYHEDSAATPPRDLMIRSG